MKRKIIATIISAILAAIAGGAVAQQNYVLCRSLLNSEVTAVFEGSCPSGWVFVSHV